MFTNNSNFILNLYTPEKQFDIYFSVWRYELFWAFWLQSDFVRDLKTLVIVAILL